MENVILTGENGTFDAILKSKYFIQAVKFWVAHLKIIVTPQSFRHYLVVPWGAVWLTLRITNLGISTYVTAGARGGVVFKALQYKPAGRGFNSRWCHWNFSVT
jgi:hypothetical protein